MPNTSSPPSQVPVDETLIEPVAKLAVDLDVSLASDEELFELAVTMERNRALTDSVECQVLAELDARGSTDTEFGHRTARWLADQTGVAPLSGKHRLAVGRQLRRHFTLFADALVDGRVTFDHCKVLVDASNDRIVDLMVEQQDEFLGLAGCLTFWHWRTHVEAVAALLDQDGSYDPNADVERNQLHLRPTPYGVALGGELVGEGAVVTREVIEQVAEEIRRQFQADKKLLGDDAPDVPSRANLLALALAEICRRAQAVNTSDGSSVKPKVEATLVLHGDRGEKVSMPDGTMVDANLIEVLRCEMSIFTVLVNSLGIPLDMGREVRTATTYQKRALAIRDGGCCFPGCGCAAAWTDSHHIDEWDRDQGRTDVKRMASFCRHHHRVIHRLGWGASIDDDGWVTITAPSGRVLQGQRHGKVRAGPEQSSRRAGVRCGDACRER